MVLVDLAAADRKVVAEVLAKTAPVVRAAQATAAEVVLVAEVGKEARAESEDPVAMAVRVTTSPFIAPPVSWGRFFQIQTEEEAASLASPVTEAHRALTEPVESPARKLRRSIVRRLLRLMGNARSTPAI